MILQLKIFLNLIKKNYKWYLLFLTLIILYLILLSVRPPLIETTMVDCFPIIGYPSLKGSFISILLFIYQCVLYVYIIFSFFKNDYLFSYENIILRINPKKWIIYKTIVADIAIIISKCIQFIITYIYFYNKIIFDFKYLLFSIIISLLITNFIPLYFSVSLKFKILTIIIELIIFIIVTYNIFPIVSVLLIVGITIFNIIFFNFKNNT